MNIPNIWENKKWQPNHQPDYICKWWLPGKRGFIYIEEIDDFHDAGTSPNVPFGGLRWKSVRKIKGIYGNMLAKSTVNGVLVGRSTLDGPTWRPGLADRVALNPYCCVPCLPLIKLSFHGCSHSDKQSTLVDDRHQNRHQNPGFRSLFPRHFPQDSRAQAPSICGFTALSSHDHCTALNHLRGKPWQQCAQCGWLAWNG